MAKKFALVVVLLLVAIFVFAGCATEDYTAVPLEGNTSGQVYSNGGLAVIKGDYLYYVNGCPSSNGVENTYGKVEIGAVVRISLFNMNQAMISANPEDVIEANAEIVVPKIIYSENVTQKFLNGIHIFGDRLYYTTPDTTIDREGAAQYTRLAIKSCNLDGTDTMHHYIFDESDYTVAFAEINGVPYACFVQNANLYLLDLTKENVTPQLVKENVSSVMYGEGIAFFINDTDICSYTFGGEVKVVMENPTVDGEPVTDTTFALMNVQDQTLYYSASALINFGFYKVTVNGDSQKLSNLNPTSYSSYTMMGWNDKFVMIKATDIKLYDPIAKTSPEDIKIESSSVTFVGIQDGYIIYTVPDADDAAVTVTKMAYYDGSQAVITVTSTKTISNWTTIDICGNGEDNYVFFINSVTDLRGFSILAVDIDEHAHEDKIVTKGYVPAA
ncbi:MAG TPA: hypothetical protein P5087_04365 [Eubacteriales bacterium]|nr:hypothetical protein [Eubacteriales bacterium]